MRWIKIGLICVALLLQIIFLILVSSDLSKIDSANRHISPFISSTAFFPQLECLDNAPISQQCTAAGCVNMRLVSDTCVNTARYIVRYDESYRTAFSPAISYTTKMISESLTQLKLLLLVGVSSIIFLVIGYWLPMANQTRLDSLIGKSQLDDWLALLLKANARLNDKELTSIIDQLLNELKIAYEIEPEGNINQEVVYDSSKHQAITGLKEGQVARIVFPGWRKHNKVIRKPTVSHQ
jgi:hypothetical protein